LAYLVKEAWKSENEAIPEARLDAGQGLPLPDFGAIQAACSILRTGVNPVTPTGAFTNIGEPVKKIFDPWADARLIAERQQLPGARLVIFLGAEAWCEKCRTLRPHIEAQAASASEDDTWVWLDLEDHAEFVGDYVPEDLPQLIIYEKAIVTACVTLPLTQVSLAEVIRRQPGATSALVDPGILANLLREDWVI
jgi:hypothetical protein